MQNAEVDYVFGCHRCGKRVYDYQILYGSHGCKKCGSQHIILLNLTNFGRWYCQKRNKLGLWYYEEFIPKYFTRT